MIKSHSIDILSLSTDKNYTCMHAVATAISEKVRNSLSEFLRLQKSDRKLSHCSF